MAVIPGRHPQRIARSIIAAGFASVLAGGAGLLPASAAEDTSFAGARFLSGTVLGTNLDDIAKLEGARAHHSGDGPTVTEGNPLKVDVLGTRVLDIDGGIQIPLNDFLELGVVNQYATAGASGIAGAGAGAVADNGAVGTGNEAGYPASATFHLAELLGEDVTDSIADIDLYAEAVTATAKVNALEGQSATDYEIASLYLEISVPLVSELLSDLASDVQASLCAAPVVGAGTAVEIDLCNAIIRVDLNRLTDGTLNEMPPNTEVLSDQVLGLLVDRLTAQLSTLADDVTELLGVDAVDGLLTQLNPVLATVEQTALAPAVEQLASLNDLISIKVNVQGDERNPTGSGIDQFVGAQQNAGFAPAVFLPAQDQPAECQTAGVTALQVSVLDGDAATLNLAAADAAGCATADEGGDAGGEDGDGGDEGGDAGGGGGDGGADGQLPDTGSAPGWLLPLGLALIAGGGITAYAFSRRNRVLHG